MKILLVLSFITCYSLSSFAQDEVISISQKSDVYNYHVLENKPLFGNTSKKEDSEKAFKEFIQNQIQNDQSVMVHCAAGLGRAGTILACYFIKYQNYSAKNAIEKIRKERPGSIQSDVQELAISYYEKYVRN